MQLCMYIARGKQTAIVYMYLNKSACATCSYMRQTSSVIGAPAL